MKPDQKPAPDDRHAEHLEMNRKAWDAYQPAYMEFHLKGRPDFFEYFAGRGVALYDAEVRLAGDVAGLTVLDVCCASSADEAFSWENLGASVIGCDISPVAIDIARQNAQRIGSRATFFVADAQELAPIESESVDLVYGRYLCWFEDIEKTLKTWYRVTKPGGRLLICTLHPITSCLEEQEGGFKLVWSYDDETPDYVDFTGTDMARLHGGWGERHPSVEFFHPTWRIVNAVVDAGFQIERMEEPVGKSGAQDDRLGLPHVLVIMARK